MLSIVLPFFSPYLTRSDILNCRRVCRNWQRDVDAFLELSYRQQNQLQIHPPSSATIALLYKPVHYPVFQPTLQENICKKLDTPDSIRDNFELYWNHQRNPIVGRSASFSNPTLRSETADIYWRQVESYLKRFGHHIWHVQLGPSISNSRVEAAYYYNILRKTLLQLPHLRTLILHGFDSDDEVTSRMERLPDLPFLEVVSFCQRGYHSSLPLILRQYFLQLKKVIFKSCQFRFDSIQLTNRFPNLTEMTVTVNNSSGWFNLEAPNLAKLNLITGGCDLQTVLNPIRRFPLLVYLKLTVLNNPYVDPGSLKLSNIKTLEIVDNDGIHYEKLIECFTSLEYFKVCQPPSTDQDKDLATARKLERFTKLYQLSTIWKKESLKEIILATHKIGAPDEVVSQQSFTRASWMFEARKNKDQKG